MDRRTFLKAVIAGVAAGVMGTGVGGCVSMVSPSVEAKRGEQPWRCKYCGHLLRSNEDLSSNLCPRCYHKELGKITEEELQQHLKAAAK